MRTTTPSRSLARRPGTLVALAAVLLLGACGVEAGDGATTSSGLSGGGDIVGSDVADTTTTEATTTTIPATDVEIIGTDGSELNDVIGNAVTDLEAFWTDAYPEAYGDPYEPLSGGLFAMDSSTTPDDIPCAAGAAIEEILNNAFYCPPGDAVAWDQEFFMPGLAEQYGPFTAAVVIAHEWGHVIQDRAQFEAPSVITELQADCFAGAWVARVDAGDSELFGVDTVQLDAALAGILSLRDAPGGEASDPLAHGSGFDRVGAFQDGFESGATRCAEYQNGDPQPFQFPFLDDDDAFNQGDMDLIGASEEAPGILDLAFPSLDAYWEDTFPTLSGGEPWNPMGDPVAFSADDPPTCNGETVEDFLLFVCIPDRFVGFEIDETIPTAYEENGDFGVAALFATQYGLDVVDQLGSADDEVSATLQGDCFAGSWAAELLPPDPLEEYQLILSPGDLDEAVSVLLSFRSEGDRERQGPGFDRVRAFRVGVLSGAEACLEIES